MDSKTKEILQKFSTQKVNLAKKPDAIIKAVESLKDKAQQAEDKMEDMYKRYSSFYQDYREKLAKIEDKAIDLEDDLDKLEQAAKELGVKVTQIDGYEKAKNAIGFIKNAKANYRNDYPIF